jgi:hypothetical protein
MPDTVSDIEDVPAAKDTDTPSLIEEGLQRSFKDMERFCRDKPRSVSLG